MKKFGLPTLLSAGYVCLLYFVFSTDFAKENSFLKSGSNENQTGKFLSEKFTSEMPSVKSRVLTFVDFNSQMEEGKNPQNMQSAESALANN